jgi:hypothetical protein
MEANWSSRPSQEEKNQEQVQEVKDKLAAELGGVGKPEGSYHQQQATEAVHNTTIAQL